MGDPDWRDSNYPDVVPPWAESGTLDDGATSGVEMASVEDPWDGDVAAKVRARMVLISDNLEPVLEFVKDLRKRLIDVDGWSPEAADQMASEYACAVLSGFRRIPGDG